MIASIKVATSAAHSAVGDKNASSLTLALAAPSLRLLAVVTVARLPPSTLALPLPLPFPLAGRFPAALALIGGVEAFDVEAAAAVAAPSSPGTIRRKKPQCWPPFVGLSAGSFVSIPLSNKVKTGLRTCVFASVAPFSIGEVGMSATKCDYQLLE
jgi:hypothetical protein